MSNSPSHDEQCIKVLLKRLGKDHTRYVDVLTLQDRLRKNLEDTASLGDTSSLRNEWAQIRRSLNQITVEATEQGFDELCDSDSPGETKAVMEVLGLNNIKLKRFPITSRISYFVYGE